MATDYEGVNEDRGKCRIRWYEGKARKSITLNLPYPSGVAKAYKTRSEHIKAYRRGESLMRGDCPTFGKLAQVRLNTANLSPETRRTQKSYLNNYWGWAFDKQIDSIHYDDCLANFGTLDKAPKTMKHILSAGSQVLEIGIESKWISDNPAKRLATKYKLAKKKPNPFSKDERDAILDQLDDGSHLFYLIRFYCGLRPSEAIALKWSDYKDGCFEINKGRVRGHDSDTTKNKTERTVPVHPVVKKALKITPRQFTDKHIITTQHGKGYRSATRLSDSFSRALKRCNIPYRSPYNVRHTCATMMLEAGMKPAYCAKVLGHDPYMFFKVYSDWIDKDESEKQAKVWASIE